EVQDHRHERGEHRTHERDGQGSVVAGLRPHSGATRGARFAGPRREGDVLVYSFERPQDVRQRGDRRRNAAYGPERDRERQRARHRPAPEAGGEEEAEGRDARAAAVDRLAVGPAKGQPPRSRVTVPEPWFATQTLPD